MIQVFFVHFGTQQCKISTTIIFTIEFSEELAKKNIRKKAPQALNVLFYEWTNVI